MANDKLGSNTRLGSGPVPTIPGFTGGSSDEFYIMKNNRSDEEFAKERSLSGLHVPDPE